MMRRRGPLGLHLLSLCLVIFGCTDPVVRMGVRANPAALVTDLRLGASTQADVARVLGEPTHKSRAMLPIDAEPRILWTYYYRENTRAEARQQYLFVLFDGDRYDGYFWFSSFPD